MSALQPGLARRGVGAVVLVALAAAAVGLLAAENAFYAIAFVLVVVVGLVVAENVQMLPLLLVFTMFVESLAFGPGLRVGRLAGALALVVVAFVLLDRGRRALCPNALLAAAGGFGLWMVASLFWAEQWSYTFSTLGSYLLGVAYLLAFAVLLRGERQLRAILLVLASGSLAFGALSFVQYAGSSGGARAAGLQGDPNYFAVYQVIALPAALALAATERRRGARIAYYAAIGVIVLSVASSLSRTGLVALAAVVLATLALPWRIFFRRRTQKTLYVGALLGAGAVAAAVGSARFVARAQTILDPGGAAGDRGSGRTDIWRAALHGWHDHPWLGLGAGNFQARALDLLQTTPGVDTTRNYVAAGRVVHNGYLELLTELGPVGLGLYVALLGLSAHYLVRAARRARGAGRFDLERYAVAVAVGLLGFAVSSFFLSNQLGKPVWIFAGLALVFDLVTRGLPRATPVAAGPSYDPAVGERGLEDGERRLARQSRAVLADQERVDRRRAALDQREQALVERERGLAEREQALRALAPERIASERRELEQLRGEVLEAQRQAADRERDLGAHVEELRAERERLARDRADVESLRAALEARDAELEVALAREQELVEVQERLVDRSAVELRQEAARLEAREADLARREEALARREQRLLSEHDEVERVRAELEARGSRGEAEDLERRLRAAESVLSVSGPALEAARAAVAERERALVEAAEERERLAGRLAAAERAAADAERRAVALQQERDAERAQRAEELARRAPEPPRPEPERLPAPEPSAASEPPAAPAPALEPRPAGVARRHALADLEQAVAQHAPSHPGRADEWSAYLFFLREHADADGTLPESFDALVDEVFGDLLR